MWLFRGNKLLIWKAVEFAFFCVGVMGLTIYVIITDFNWLFSLFYLLIVFSYCMQTYRTMKIITRLLDLLGDDDEVDEDEDESR